MSSYDVLAIGNALMDILSSVDDDFFIKHDLQKGSMTLISEEQATIIYDAMGQTRQISGGSAANTVAALANMGTKTAFIGAVSDDAVGNNFTHDLRAIGVDFKGHTHNKDQGATGRCNVLVSDDAQRTMATYLGCAGNIPPTLLQESLQTEMIKNSKIIYIEGYLWDQDATKSTLKDALNISKSAGNKTAFTLSDVFCVERHRDEFMDLIRDQFDIIFANEDEIKSLFKRDNFNDALQDCCAFDKKIFALTRGEKGSVIVAGSQIHIADAMPPRQLLDTTGAGDSFAAGFLYGLSKNMSYYDAAVTGSVIAAEMISHFGARAVADLSELIANYKKVA